MSKVVVYSKALMYQKEDIYKGQVKLRYHSKAMGVRRRELYVPVEANETKAEFCLEKLVDYNDCSLQPAYGEERILEAALKIISNNWEEAFKGFKELQKKEKSKIIRENWTVYQRGEYELYDEKAKLLYGSILPKPTIDIDELGLAFSKPGVKGPTARLARRR